MKKFPVLLLVLLLASLVGCDKNNPTDPDENFSIPSDAEMPTIIYSGTDDFSRNMNFDLEIEKGRVLYRQIFCYNYDSAQVHQIDLPEILWQGLKATTNLEQLKSVTMQPRCGNQMEYITIISDTVECGFGFELGSPLESIKSQVDGATDSVLGFVHQLRIIDQYCYEQIMHIP